MKTGHRDLAETFYLAAIRLDSSFVMAYHNQAVAYGGVAATKRRSICLKRALPIEPGTAPSYCLLALEQGAYNRAEETLVRVVAADSAGSEALWSLGRFPRMLGRLAESEEMLMRAQRFAPNSKEAHPNWGCSIPIR